jgi:hypothetical protein
VAASDGSTKRCNWVSSTAPPLINAGLVDNSLRAYVMLASEESSYITGALLAVSGRKSML